MQRTEQEHIDVLVVDDHPIVRHGVAALIGRAPEISLVGEASRAEEALRFVTEEEPDVVLLDVRLGEDSGIDLCRKLKEAAPNTAVIMLSGYWDDELLRRALDAGAIGYLLKDAERPDFVRAIRAAAQGQAVFDPIVAGAVLRSVGRVPGGRRNVALSEQERQVLRLVSQGMTNRAIAAALYLSPHTVKDYVSSIMMKLSAKNRTEAVVRATNDHVI
ncbi:MAG: response regulator transcription factor [Dehalococcoidia bacterium]